MIKLKQLLLEGKPPSIFIPRRVEDRLERYIKDYIRNGSKGNLNLSGLNLTKLPEILKNISVGGLFDCSNNNLTSLINAPKSIGGNFWCGYNKLTSLECAHITVGRDFHCSKNLLTSLIGAPTIVHRDFYCSDNSVQFTGKDVKSVCDVKGKIFV